MVVIDVRSDPRVCQRCLGHYGYRIEPCGVCEKRAALEQRADRAAQAWRMKANAEDLGELLANFAERELHTAEVMARGEVVTQHAVNVRSAGSNPAEPATFLNPPLSTR